VHPLVQGNVVAQRSVAEAFYAGQYGEVLGRTIDGRSCAYTEDETPFVVGALAFAGRVEEARAVLSSLPSGPRARPASRARDREAASLKHAQARVASKFFLGVAYDRAGRHTEAEREFRDNLGACGAHADPVCRFYVAQGLACLRYFRGRMILATRHVRRSLRYAIEARFQYGRLLASDLRGHALVQIGQVRAGLALLERARDLARAMELSGNVGAIECSLAIYRARFGVAPLGRAIEELEALTRATSAEDSYSRRAVETELAKALALAGRGDEAWAKLEALSARRIPDGDERARVRFLLSCAAVSRLRYGLESARTYAAEARAALHDDHDLALEVELICAELVVADARSRAMLLRRLGVLHATTGISRAAVYKAVFDEGAEAADAMRVAEFEEDRTGARLADAWSGNQGSLDKLVRDGHLGLLPIASRVSPEAAIVETATERFAIAERGKVRIVDEVPGGPARLLREIGSVSGEGRAWHGKESLLAKVWGITRYRPDRHDALVHTAVSRLRGLLGTAGHWIECRDGAYRLAPDVAFSSCVPDVPVAAAPMWRELTREASTEGDAATREQALLVHLLASGACSTADIAVALRVSEMTAFRTLRALVERGLVVRTGKGPSTRYTAVDSEEGRRQ
jgi:hypothetical protein